MGITIDITALARLPQDGNISHLVSVTEDCSAGDTPIPEADRSTASEVKEEHLSQSFVPISAPSMREQEAVQQVCS